jgi:hypothetical protein
MKRARQLMAVEFSSGTALSAEGARVALVSCERCGAAILLDPRDETGRMQQHLQWHQEGNHEAGV